MSIIFTNFASKISKRNIMKSKFYLLLFIACAFFTSCTVVSHKDFVEKDYRNTDVPIVVTGIPFTGVITIDMQKTDNYNFSKADMYRCYLQAADILKDKDYSKVYLANKGEKIFYLEGTYFKELGMAYSLGCAPNFEMQEHVLNLDGTHAYETWTGGWLGVMNKQLEDFSDMMDKLCP